MFSLIDPSAYVPIGCYTDDGAPELSEKQCQQISENKPSLFVARWSGAMLELLKMFGCFSFSYVLLFYSPWFLLPICWVFLASSFSMLYAILHDCAHNNFFPSKTLNAFFGQIFSVACCLQTFECFCVRHSKHINKKLKKSPSNKELAAAPVVEKKDSKQARLMDEAREAMLDETPLGTILEFLSDTVEHSHFSLSTGLLTSVLFFLVPAVIYFFGFQTFLKFYLAPLLLFHFLRSLFLSYLYTSFVNFSLPSTVSFQIPSYSLPSFVKTLIDSNVLAAKPVNGIQKLREWAKEYGPRINWLHVIILMGSPVAGMYLAQSTPLQSKTLWFAFFYYCVTGLGITAGYHRLFAHRAYEVTPLWKWIMVLAGSGALEGSVKWWCGGHRTHHRYTDTDVDPYSANGGFWYAHIGWMLIHPKKELKVKADIADLNADPLIRFQHKYYLFIGPLMAYVLPTLVCGLGWGDFMGGYVYAGLLRGVLVHHGTFAINSVAHYFGEQTFDDVRSPRDSAITALITFGEGYHNFHHEFPNDYRNGLKWYDYDPTKWLISLLSIFGSASNLKVFNDNEIRLGMIAMREKKLQELKQSVKFPTAIADLPVWTMEQVHEKIAQQRVKLLIIHNVVFDVTDFIPMHPGGQAYLLASVGKDATDKFEGKTGIYKHSNAARNFLQRFRVAKLAGAIEVPQIEADAVKKSQ